MKNKNDMFGTAMITMLGGCVLWIYAIFHWVDTGSTIFILCMSILTGVITGVAAIVGVVYAILVHSRRNIAMLQEVMKKIETGKTHN